MEKAFYLPIFLSSDIQLPNVPKLSQWFDCTLPDPFVPNTYSSLNKTKNEINTSMQDQIIFNKNDLTLPNAWKPKSVNWWHPATSSVFNRGLCWASEVSVWSVNSTHFDTHNFCKFKHVSLIFWMDTSVILYLSNRKKKSYQFDVYWNEIAFKQCRHLHTSQLCKLSTVNDLQYVAKQTTALLLTCLHPLLLNRLNLGQPRDSASTPFSVIESHHEIFISNKFCLLFIFGCGRRKKKCVLINASAKFIS